MENELVQTASTPIDMNMSKDTSSKVKYEQEYQQMVGFTNYIAITRRPDISYAVQALATSMSHPTKLVMNQAKQLFTYLQNTRDCCIPIGTHGGIIREGNKKQVKNKKQN
eukprot:snap_masked-scaffold_3-processed-gene-13.3-mRNA-1 protein AED:1.00 eAED:1.00 QI:0/0/0/0/1/1/2/0/109